MVKNMVIQNLNETKPLIKVSYKLFDDNVCYELSDILIEKMHSLDFNSKVLIEINNNYHILFFKSKHWRVYEFMYLKNRNTIDMRNIKVMMVSNRTVSEHNPPHFSSTHYEVTVFDNTTVRTPVAVIYAKDPDTGRLSFNG